MNDHERLAPASHRGELSRDGGREEGPQHPCDCKHNHAHPMPKTRTRLNATLLVTGLIMLAETAGGYLSGSLSLMADAGHMLTDFLALVVASAAIALGQRKADERRTYGYRRLEILAALANGIALVLVSGSIFYEAVQRWMTPHTVEVGLMAGIAAIGLVSNIVGLLLLKGQRENLNVRGAFLHILGDTFSSVGVIVAAGLIAWTGWVRADAIVSIVIAVIIIVSSLALLREVFDVLLEAAPRHIDTEQVRRTISGVAGVLEVHDLHVWTIASGMAALSAHVVVDEPAHDQHLVLMAIQRRLRREYAIDHSTLQLERCPEEICGCRGDGRLFANGGAPEE